MADLIYWAGQLVLLEAELVGMVLIVVMPALWIIGATIEIWGKWRLYKPIKIFKSDTISVDDLAKAYGRSTK